MKSLKKIMAVLLTVAMTISFLPQLPVVVEAETNILVTDKEVYKVGEPISVTATSDDANAWVGIYKASDEPAVNGSNVQSIYWYYINGAETEAGSGNVTWNSGDTVVINSKENSVLNASHAALAVLPEGEYIIVILGGDSYYDVLESKTITIEADEDATTPEASTEHTIVTDKDTYEVGEPIKVTATSTDSNAWVAICKKDEVLASGGTPSIYWYYINGDKTQGTAGTDSQYDIDVLHTSGETVVINDITQAVLNSARAVEEVIPDGEYKIVILGGNSYYDVLATKNITIGTPGKVTEPSLSVDKTEYAVDENGVCSEDIMVTATAGKAKDWIGLYKAGDPIGDESTGGAQSVYWYYIMGVTTLEIPAQKTINHINGQTYAINNVDPTGAAMPANSILNTKRVEDVAENGNLLEGEYVIYLFEDDSYKVIDSKTIHVGHDLEEIERKDATCTEDGYVKSRCKLCQEEVEETITAKGHVETGVVTDPTCTEDGYITYTCEVCGYSYQEADLPKLGHEYDAVVTPATCGKDGEITYTCKRCNDSYTEVGDKATGAHKYVEKVTPATLKADGKIVKTCSVCGEKQAKDTVIAKVASVVLAKNTYVYTAKAEMPKVVVKDSTGKALVTGKDYTAAYEENGNLPGKHSVTVTLKGNYSGSTTLTYTVRPAKVTNLKVKKLSVKKIKVTWKKAANITGYQIQYAKNKKFTKGLKSVQVKKAKVSSKTIKKLKKGKYFVKIRAYVTDQSGKIYGDWSKAKKITLK